MADPFLDLTDYSLVWGPLRLPEPAWSFADEWKSEIYTPDEVAGAILSVPGTRLTHPAVPGWECWAAEWADCDRRIEFDLTASDIDSDNETRPGISLAWGGSKFDIHCRLSDVLKVWRAIRQRCPAVWLHDTNCRIHSPESFIREYGGVNGG